MIEQLASAGHDVEVVADYTEMMGHAGAVAFHPGGLIEGATDPRARTLIALRNKPHLYELAETGRLPPRRPHLPDAENKTRYDASKPGKSDQ